MVFFGNGKKLDYVEIRIIKHISLIKKITYEKHSFRCNVSDWHRIL